MTERVTWFIFLLPHQTNQQLVAFRSIYLFCIGREMGTRHPGLFQGSHYPRPGLLPAPACTVAGSIQVNHGPQMAALTLMLHPGLRGGGYHREEGRQGFLQGSECLNSSPLIPPKVSQIPQITTPTNQEACVRKLLPEAVAAQEGRMRTD